MTIGGRSAVTEVAKKAPLSAAAAIEASPKDFMMADEWL
jgi:ABC-type hemin transport system substrate-binding protein